MSTSRDYSQPNFFRFGGDSLYLVREVCQRMRPSSAPPRVVELGAGCGVIICELSQKVHLGPVTLVEAQREWQPHLEHNLLHFGQFREGPVVYWERVSRFNLHGELQADLIVSNPPYFVPGRGRASPNPQRNIAHRLMLDPWEAWLACMCRTLVPGGEAWYLQKKLDRSEGSPVLPQGLSLKLELISGPMGLICLSRL
jgi:tRNA1(Val) A37 N6-methylase TrmN6